jgi:intein/homing endonuclease
MYLASRGFGKSYLLAVYATLRCILIPDTKIVIVGAAFRQSKVIFEYMETIWRDAPILKSICSDNSGPRRDVDRCTMRINGSWAVAVPLGCMVGETMLTTDSGIEYLSDLREFKGSVYSNSEFKDVGFFYDNGVFPTYKVTTNLGNSYQATPNHKMKVVRNNKIVWCRTDKIKIGDRILINRSERWFNPSFECTEDQAYCLGLMIGDGNYTNKYFMRYTTVDKEFLTVLNNTIGEFTDQKDDKHYQLNSKKTRQDWLDFWDIKHLYHYEKVLPKNILRSSKENMASCLRGLFDTDGYVTNKFKNGGWHSAIGYTTTSHTLALQIQYILMHFGIICTIHSRDRKSPRTGNDARRCHDLIISGINIKLFIERIGFRLSRKKQICEEILQTKKRWMSNQDTIPINKSIILDIAKNNYIGHRFGYKDVKNSRKELTINYMEKFMSACKQKGIDCSEFEELINRDYYYAIVVDKHKCNAVPTFDINVPDNNTYCANGFVSHNTGEKIRGLRAHTVIADEFNSIPIEIYEQVVEGFAAVSKDPIINIKEAAKRKQMQAEGVWNVQHQIQYDKKHRNQSIISGTAGYDFEPYADYWKKYKATIESRGDMSILLRDDDSAIQVEIPDYMSKLDWKQFSILRIPYELIPEGFMSDEIIARAKATMHAGTYMMEYGASFAKDSQGFYKRTLIESCVASDKNTTKDNWPIWCPVSFDVETRGHSDRKYVYGIDPASEIDNFAIVVLELHPAHQRVVYVWTTNKKDFQARKRLGLTDTDDYYSFCVRKIRDLMILFPCVRIGIDSQGGGYQIAEGLSDSDKIREEYGEVPILEIIDPDKKKETDRLPGAHILEFVNFASAEWTSNANHGLRKDMEDKFVLFPRFDAATVSLMGAQDEIRFKKLKEQIGDSPDLKLYDTLEDCVMDIEELKNEMSTIIVTRTPSGREKFDTPEIKLATGKKGRMRKDRYSAMVIANMVGRSIHRELPAVIYHTVGRVAGVDPSGKIAKITDNRMAAGGQWNDYTANCVKVVKR